MAKSKGKTLRFAVGDPQGRRSAQWFVTAVGDEVFVAADSMRKNMKASLHPSGQWQQAFHKEFFDSVPAELKPANRYMTRWIKPGELGPGVTLAYRIVIPSSELQPVAKPTSLPKTIWVPPGPTDGWMEFQIWLLNRALYPGEWPGRTGRGTSFLGSLPLSSGTVVVTYLGENAKSGMIWIANQLVLVHTQAERLAKPADWASADKTQMWGVALAVAEDGSRLFMEFRNPLGDHHSPTPATASEWAQRGDLLVRAGLLADAIDAYDEALLLNADFYGARQNRGVAYSLLGRVDEALAEFATLALTHPEVPDARLNVGTMKMAKGDLEGALESFDDFLLRWPERLEAITNRAAVLKKLGRLNEALDAMEKACALKSDGNQHLDRAKVLAALGRTQDEEEALRQAVSLDPDLSKARLELGRLLLLKREHEEALDQFKAASWVGDEDAARLGIAAAMSGLGQTDKALEMLERALLANPADVQVLSLKAMTLSGVKRHRDALEAAEAGLAVEPKNPILAAIKAVELNELGHHDQALRAAEEAVQLDVQPLTLSAKAAALLELGRYSEVLTTTDQVLELDDLDPQIHFFGACAYAELGEVDASVESLRRAIDRGWHDLDALREESHLRSLWANPQAVSELEALVMRATKENPTS
jgi:tetratricopeptide (TPR) repeat protein